MHAELILCAVRQLIVKENSLGLERFDCKTLAALTRGYHLSFPSVFREFVLFWGKEKGAKKEKNSPFLYVAGVHV
jgi:hypothetical protein